MLGKQPIIIKYNKVHLYNLGMSSKEHLQETFFIDGNSLSLQNVDDCFARKKKVDLTPEAWQKVDKSRKLINKMMHDPDRIVYGINTGFGNFADKIISVDQRKALQINLITSHAVGVGLPLPVQTSKRVMLLRINTLAKGRSGISTQNLRRYIDAFNANYIPCIPEKGTVGASGDLAPLSHLAVGMLGQGLAWDDKKQQYVQAGELMKRLNLKTLDLNQKQGLALINGTQFMTSILSEVLKDTQRLLQSAIVILAFSVEIFGLEYKFFTDKHLQLYERNNPSLVRVMKKVRACFDQDMASDLHTHRASTGASNNRSHSVLQACQSLAGVYDTLQFCSKIVQEEMNSATDNPLVYSKDDGFEDDQLISAGNFHGQYVAKASDFIGMALFTVGRYSEARIQRYINERFSKLPSFLINNGGLNSGFMITQYTSAALLSETKVLVKPASVDSIQTSASQEDHVSMGGYAARKSRTILDNISFILGIQMMLALQSVDLMGGFKPSRRLTEIHQRLRKDIPYLETDQYFGPKITVARDLVMKDLNQI